MKSAYATVPVCDLTKKGNSALYWGRWRTGSAPSAPEGCRFSASQSAFTLCSLPPWPRRHLVTNCPPMPFTLDGGDKIASWCVVRHLMPGSDYAVSRVLANDMYWLRGQSPPINITGNPPNFGGLIHFMIPLFSCFFLGGGEKIQYNMEFNSLN